MKLGRTARIVLIVGAFIVAFFVVNQMKTEAESAQRSLKVQLQLSQTILPNLAAEKETLKEQFVLLESELAEANASLGESREVFPVDIQSIEYDEILFDIAHDWDLDIVSLTASEPYLLEVETIIEPTDPQAKSITYTVDYSVTNFNITVEGQPIEPAPEKVAEFRDYIYQTVDDILSYFDSIATGDDFTTAWVDSVIITVPEPYTELEVTGTEEEEETEETTTEEEEEEEVLLEAVPATATINLVIYSYEGEE
ncbi:MAG: hypothetical protein PHY18_03650 [Dehalococcoidales bacterium]|nr:hypothetical protein [Dehalococcoidales bacterium]